MRFCLSVLWGKVDQLHGIDSSSVVIHGTIWEMEFLIVDASSSYNGILGRLAMNKLKATISTYSLRLEIRTPMGLFSI